ncbi:hypothetical protein EW145_g4995 [Phellinidium pouzarii]|uniref:Uncharacterized protein n=1 Tax=Phellinidium pouzarii TaxID=167371 RepID=A0A4S4L1L9_9AGAM|nr:hypothetical protein EW145_g4995 [Phellinidium pouzarii]
MHRTYSLVLISVGRRGLATSNVVRPPAPPFTEKTAQEKVKAAQKLWNTRDPQNIALAYTTDSIWRNRDLFPHGREKIVDFLTEKWQKETRYKCESLTHSSCFSFSIDCEPSMLSRLRKELFSWTGNKIAVQFWYEFYDEAEMLWPRYSCDIRRAKSDESSLALRSDRIVFFFLIVEDWSFNANDLMEKRQMIGNDIKIAEADRWFSEDMTDEDVDKVHITAEQLVGSVSSSRGSFKYLEV